MTQVTANRTNGRVGGSPVALRQVTARIREVSSLPRVVQQIIDIVNDPNSSAADLKSVVEMDPPLSVRLLRTVNSAAYRTRMEIRTVHHAIAYLGFEAVRNMALASTIAEIFKSDDRIGRYSRQALWRHLVCVGVASRMIAARVGLGNFEDAFLAGLLHDLGIILLDQYHHPQFVATMESLEPDETLCRAEERLLGFTHAEIGDAVARRWNLPSTVIAALLHHHDAQACPDGNKRIVEVVQVANFICTSKGISSVGTSVMDPPSAATLNSLALDRDDFQVLWEDLDEELENAEVLARI